MTGEEGRRGVIVVGAVNVDFVVAATRLPGPGETVVGADLERHGGGKGANAAVAAARAGAHVTLVGAVGQDDDGVRALQELRAEGVDVAGVAVLEDRPTGVALIVVDPAGENQIAVGAGANAAVRADHVSAAVHAAMPGAGCVLVSTEIPGDAVVAAVEAATAAGVLCILNPAPVIPAVLALLSAGPLLTPNATELADLADALGPATAGEADDQIQAAGDAVLRRTRAPVVVTLGGDGAAVFAPGADPQNVAPRPTTVVDTTGAGDTFNGVLATRLASGDPLARAVQVATAAASLSVTQVGARSGMPTAEAIAGASPTG